MKNNLSNQTSQHQIRNSIDTYFMPISIQPVSKPKSKRDSLTPQEYRQWQYDNDAERKALFNRRGPKATKLKREQLKEMFPNRNVTISLPSLNISPRNNEEPLICTLLNLTQENPVQNLKTSQQKGETPSKVDDANPSKHIPWHRKVIKRGKTGEYAKEKVCPRENCQHAFKVNLFLGSKCFCEMTLKEKWLWHHNRKKLAKEREAFMQDCYAKLREQNDYIRFDTPPPSVGDDYLSQALAQLESMGRTPEQIETFKAMYQELGKA